MKKIPLTKGAEAIVDDEDYSYLSQFSWYLNSTGDAVRSELGRSKGRKHIRMHREILNAPNNKVVDHKNGNRLDNRKSNLRLCSKKDNNHNSKKPKHNTSGFKGVSWHKASKKWRAYIKYNRKTIQIGTFENILDAARAYDNKAQELFGDFAKLNM